MYVSSHDPKQNRQRQQQERQLFFRSHVQFHEPPKSVGKELVNRWICTESLIKSLACTPWIVDAFPLPQSPASSETQKYLAFILLYLFDQGFLTCLTSKSELLRQSNQAGGRQTINIEFKITIMQLFGLSLLFRS